MSSDFGYVNARIRGIAARGVRDDVLQAAVDSTDFRAFTDVVSQTVYGPSYDEAKTVVSGLQAVDQAVSRHVQDVTGRLMRFSDGAPHEVVAALLLKNDADDLKSLARSVHAGGSSEGIREALSGLGTIRPQVLERLAEASDLPAAAQVLSVTKHPLAPAFTKAVRGYASDGDLLRVELQLDRALYERMAESAQRIKVGDAFNAYVGLSIDATNILTALKITSKNLDSDAYFLEHGRFVSRRMFDALVADGVTALSSMATGPFAPLAGIESAGEVEGAIRDIMQRWSRKAAQGDPLGVGVVLKFLQDKADEAAKMRLLARGKYYGVARERLVQELGDDA
jgi:V/A-type H+-transporting ATPase subunit C